MTSMSVTGAGKILLAGPALSRSFMLSDLEESDQIGSKNVVNVSNEILPLNSP